MDFSWSQAGLAGALLLATGVLVAAYLKYLATGSERRMRRMLQRAGLDPTIADETDVQGIMTQIRRRCRKCQSEDVCERWLSGEIGGKNTFCPNRRVIEELAEVRQTAKRQNGS